MLDKLNNLLYLCSANHKTHEFMVKNYLFAPVFRKIGYSLLIVAVIFFVLCLSFDQLAFGIEYPMISLTPQFEEEWSLFKIAPRITQGGWFEIVMTLMCVGCVFVAFSKEKEEDECIAQIRMQSLVWALMVNMVLVLLTTLFIYGGSYLTCMAVYPFSTFLFFIIKYNISLSQFRKNNEE